MISLPKRMQKLGPSHQRAKVQERELAKKIRQTKNSGAGAEKGDVRVVGLARIECKTTKNKSYRLTVSDIEKIENATFGNNEIPVMEIELELGKKKVLVVPTWAMDILLGG
jgi:hypothetical protein